VEKNKGRDESRSIITGPMSAEQAAFPLAAQAARLRRHTTDRKEEEVCLLTSVPPEQLDAQAWLRLNRTYWGIENGLHQRLDVSFNDDRCRIRLSPGLWVMGMFRRLSNSLFMEWRGGQKHPEHQTTTDFHSALAEENRRPALRLVSSKNPRLKGG
jgi:predicted transposase YbfD/YdcC